MGSTVNAVYSKNKEKRSDVLTVARFLHHVLENKRGWVVKGIDKLLKGKSGLATPDGMDIFAGRFEALRETSLASHALYTDILARLFHSPGGGGLHLCDIRGSAGELGLKAAGADDHFGLIYIGDTSEFKKLVENDKAGIVLEEDVIAGSLFEDINRPDSRVNILIGAKKFMEGWNSWRVSNMGLLNIGKKEGSQIIQLFGRGVRLRGKGNSLKRSAAIEGTHPPRLRSLETLSIFAVRANYMAQFRDYLEREGVETEPLVELPLFVWANEQFLQRGLVLPRPKEGRDFTTETMLLFACDESIRLRVDLSVKVQVLESRAEGLHDAKIQTGYEGIIQPERLGFVDWEQAYLDLLDYKARKGFGNLVIRPETLRVILDKVPYTLIADEVILRPRSFEDRYRLQEAVTTILRKYLDLFYRHARERWDSQNMVYRPLDLDDPNLSFNSPNVQEKKAAYTVRVPHSRSDLIAAIENLRDDMEKLITEENSGLPRIHFDRHLYLPLLLKRDDDLNTEPPALEESEEQFVRDLKAYWEAEQAKSKKGKDVFLLRNLSRGKGVGFFEDSGFYPDFILWIVDGKSQRIVFIEPHGMLHAKAYIHDDKANLWEYLPELAKKIGQRSEKKNILLDSFIVSATPYEDLYKHYDDGTWDRWKFAKNHILFQERNQKYDYIEMCIKQSE